MAKNTKICKICGAEYEYCKTKAEQFRWQDVACCESHAVEYFNQIAISRGDAVEAPKITKVKDIINEIEQETAEQAAEPDEESFMEAPVEDADLF